MKNESEAHTHHETSTTVRATAAYWPFSFGFFCSRQTESDVVEPKNSKEQKDPKKLMPHLPNPKV